MPAEHCHSLYAENALGTIIKSKRIVVLDDNMNELTALGLLLCQYFSTVTHIPFPFELLDTIASYRPDVVLLDMKAKGVATPARKPIALRHSPAMRQVLSTLDRVATTDANLFLTGENESGKEVFASYAYVRPQRAAEPLVHIDMRPSPARFSRVNSLAT